jgi:hypothetical protein
MAIARAKGRLRGKQAKLSIRQQAHLVQLHQGGKHTIVELAELFSILRPTVYRVLERARDTSHQPVGRRHHVALKIPRYILVESQPRLSRWRGRLELCAFAATPKEGIPVGEAVRLPGGTVTFQNAVDAFLDHQDLSPPPGGSTAFRSRAW